METKIQEIRGHFGLPSHDASKEAKIEAKELENGPKMEPKVSQRRLQRGQREAKELQNGGKMKPQEPTGGIMEIQVVQNGSLWSLLSPLGERSSQASAASERAKRLTLQEGELRV